MPVKNNDDFDHILTNAQRVFKLSTYVKEFTEERNVVFIYEAYVYKSKTDNNFSLSKTRTLLQDAVDSLPRNASIFCRKIVNCMRALMHLEVTSSSLETLDTIKNKQNNYFSIESIGVEKMSW